MSITEDIKRILFVHKCASCREILDYKSFNSALCPECRTAFEVAKTQSCPKCFRAACECTCQPQMLSKGGSLVLRKLFFYSADKDTEAQNKLVYYLKRHPNKRSFEFCAQQLSIMINEELSDLGIQNVSERAFVVNMPRSRRAVRQYGFDQSGQICQAISRISGIPYVNALLRKNGGREQKKLTAAERKHNIEGRIYPNVKALDDVKGRYAILVDDIVTTGASMSACLGILRKMGVNGIICVSLAVDLKNKRAR